MELNKNNFSESEKLFNHFRYHISVQGVIDGTVLGRIFTDNNGTSAVAVSPQGIFLGGDLSNENFFKEMNSVMKEDLLPKYCDNHKLDYVVFFPQNKSENKALSIMFDGLCPMKSTRMTFSNDMTTVEANLPEGIFEVTADMLSNTNMPGVDGVLEEIYGGWNSIDEFLSRGFGTVAIHEDKVIGWCLTDWVVGGECEIGIETYPEYRRQGIGHKMTEGTLVLAKRRGIKRTGWQCWSDNYGSIATAKSAGFKLISEFPVLFAWSEELNNMLINGNYYMLGKENLNISPDYVRSAWYYEQALEKGWDWGGYPVLYWNCACMLYKSGQKNKAKHYYKLALEKGWKGVEDHIGNPYVYNSSDIEGKIVDE
jgi:RimJ/RimL family protein N-acetyltransferase